MPLSLIAAIGVNNKEIGYQGTLPWRLKTDVDNFKKLTTGHTVIMGRKTHESLGKALPKRTNIVISRNTSYSLSDCLVASSFAEAMRLIPTGETEAFVMGGAEIYAIALAHINRMYLTEVDYAGPADTYFPDYNPAEWKLISSEEFPQSNKDQFSFRFEVYDRKSPIDSRHFR